MGSCIDDSFSESKIKELFQVPDSEPIVYEEEIRNSYRSIPILGQRVFTGDLQDIHAFRLIV